MIEPLVENYKGPLTFDNVYFNYLTDNTVAESGFITIESSKEDRMHRHLFGRALWRSACEKAKNPDGGMMYTSFSNDIMFNDGMVTYPDELLMSRNQLFYRMRDLTLKRFNPFCFTKDGLINKDYGVDFDKIEEYQPPTCYYVPNLGYKTRERWEDKEALYKNTLKFSHNKKFAIIADFDEPRSSRSSGAFLFDNDYPENIWFKSKLHLSLEVVHDEEIGTRVFVRTGLLGPLTRRTIVFDVDKQTWNTHANLPDSL